MRKLSVIAAMLLLAPGISQAKSLEELLVEKGVITKGEAMGSANGGAAKMYWNNGTRLEFPDTGFTTSIATEIRTRYTYTDPESGDESSNFSQEDAELIISGTALHNEFAYKVSYQFASGSGALNDAYLQWNACDWGSVRMGQWKTFISRQWNVSEYKLQLPDRSIASDFVTGSDSAFGSGRDQGVAGMINVDDEWEIKGALFNGEGKEPNSNPDTDHLYQASLRWNPMGKFDAYSESDVDYSDELGMSVGVAYSFESNAIGGNDAQVINADLSAKYQGFYGAFEFFYTDVDDVDENPTSWYVQAGYFFVPKKFEVAGRWSRVDLDGAVDGTVFGDFLGNEDEVDEYTLGFNYYWWKHNLKAGLAYTRVDADDAESDEVVVQLTGYF
jgi:hypothetical protein